MVFCLISKTVSIINVFHGKIKVGSRESTVDKYACWSKRTHKSLPLRGRWPRRGRKGCRRWDKTHRRIVTAKDDISFYGPSPLQSSISSRPTFATLSTADAVPLSRWERLAWLLRSQIKVRSFLFIIFRGSFSLFRLLRSQRFFFLPCRRFLAFLAATLARGGFAGLLALVLRCAPAGDGELAFFLALDVAEDVARRAAAQIPIIV